MNIIEFTNNIKFNMLSDIISKIENYIRENNILATQINGANEKTLAVLLDLIEINEIIQNNVYPCNIIKYSTYFTTTNEFEINDKIQFILEINNQYPYNIIQNNKYYYIISKEKENNIFKYQISDKLNGEIINFNNSQRIIDSYVFKKGILKNKVSYFAKDKLINQDNIIEYAKKLILELHEIGINLNFLFNDNIQSIKIIEENNFTPSILSNFITLNNTEEINKGLFVNSEGTSWLIKNFISSNNSINISATQEYIDFTTIGSPTITGNYISPGTINNYAWTLTGNYTTDDNFIGTINDQTLTFKIDNKIVAKFIPEYYNNVFVPNVLIGYIQHNNITNSVGNLIFYNYNNITGGDTNIIFSNNNKLIDNTNIIILNGNNNFAYKNSYTTIIGEINNIFYTRLCFIQGSNNIINRAHYSFIAGVNNKISNLNEQAPMIYSNFIIGGRDIDCKTIIHHGNAKTTIIINTEVGNRIIGDNCSILNGCTNNITGSFNIIANGCSTKYVTVHKEYFDPPHPQYGSEITVETPYFPLGNSISGVNSVILNGTNNDIIGNFSTILNGSKTKFIVTGYDSEGSPSSGFIFYYNNSIYGNYSLILNGYSNKITGNNCIIGGTSVTAKHNNCFIWSGYEEGIESFEENSVIFHTNKFIISSNEGYYSLPKNQGQAGQVLMSDGNNQTYWANIQFAGCGTFVAYENNSRGLNMLPYGITAAHYSVSGSLYTLTKNEFKYLSNIDQYLHKNSTPQFNSLSVINNLYIYNKNNIQQNSAFKNNNGIFQITNTYTALSANYYYLAARGNGRIKITNTILYNNMTEFSMSLWFKWEGNSWIWYNGDSTSPLFIFATNNDKYYSFDWNNIQLFNYQYNNTNFSHFVITLNTHTKTIKFYINNNLAVSAINNNISPANNVASTDYMFYSYSSYYKGCIDELYFWDRELTPEEISNIYNNGNGKIITKNIGEGINLIAGYNFNEGAGKNINDQTNEHNAEIINDVNNYYQWISGGIITSDYTYITSNVLSSIDLGVSYKKLHNILGEINNDISIIGDNTTILTNNYTAESTGGYILYTNILHSAGVKLTSGSSSWQSVSDKNQKENWQEVNYKDVLFKLEQIPIYTWNWKSQDPNIRHIGPFSQDFKIFNVGDNPEYAINTVDADGVALAAIKGLKQIIDAQQDKIIQLENRINFLHNIIKMFNTMI